MHGPRNGKPRKKAEPVTFVAQTRPIYEIAREIYLEWQPRRDHTTRQLAEPHLWAMLNLDKIDDPYGSNNNARRSITEFLHHAGSWHGGETAKRLKAELRGILAQ